MSSKGVSSSPKKRFSNETYSKETSSRSAALGWVAVLHEIKK
jgi:hypothetical protein